MTAENTHTLRRIARYVELAIRWPLFLVMLYLRGVAFFLLGGIGGLCAFCFVFVLAFSDKASSSNVLWIFGSISTVAFLIQFFYDSILIKLSPRDSGLIF